MGIKTQLDARELFPTLPPRHKHTHVCWEGGGSETSYPCPKDGCKAETATFKREMYQEPKSCNASPPDSPHSFVDKYKCLPWIQCALRGLVPVREAAPVNGRLVLLSATLPLQFRGLQKPGSQLREQLCASHSVSPI